MRIVAQRLRDETSRYDQCSVSSCYVVNTLAEAFVSQSATRDARMTFADAVVCRDDRIERNEDENFSTIAKKTLSRFSKMCTLLSRSATRPMIDALPAVLTPAANSETRDRTRGCSRPTSLTDRRSSSQSFSRYPLRKE